MVILHSFHFNSILIICTFSQFFTSTFSIFCADFQLSVFHLIFQFSHSTLVFLSSLKCLIYYALMSRFKANSHWRVCCFLFLQSYTIFFYVAVGLYYFSIMIMYLFFYSKEQGLFPWIVFKINFVAIVVAVFNSMKV